MFCRYRIGAGGARGIVPRGLIDPHVSVCIATGSRLWKPARGSRLVRFGTGKTFAFGLVRISGRSGLGGPAGGSGGSWGRTRTSVQGYGDDEGGSFGEGQVLMVIWKANDVCRKTTK